MENVKEDLLNRQEEDQRHYVVILTPIGIYRLYQAHTVRDVISSLKKFVSLGDQEPWEEEKWTINYKHIILSRDALIMLLPRGAVLEAIKEST